MEGTVSCGTLAQSPLSGRMELTQALTGVGLAAFTLVHLCLVASVLISPTLTNAIGLFLEHTYLAWIVGYFILFIMVVHFVLAARKMPFQVGTLPVFFSHAKEMKHRDTWLWLAQVVTAVILLVMLSTHIYVMLSVLPTSPDSTVALDTAAREQGGWTPFYLLLLATVGVHMGIGIFRVGVKYGYICAANRALWTRRTWYLIGGYIGVGVLTMIRYHFMTV